MADETTKKEEEGTPAWATQIQDGLNKLTELLSNQSTTTEKKEEVQEVQVPPPPAPAPTEQEVEDEEQEEQEEQEQEVKPSRGKAFLNWLF